MSNLNRHIKSDKAKWIITGIVFVLILAILGGVVAAVVTETNPKDWFNKPSEEVTEELPIESDGDLSGIISDNEFVRLAMGAAVTAADGEYVERTLTATVSPAEAAEKGVTWAIAWADGSSDVDINDYLVLTPSGNTATVRCYAAFEKDALITATTVEGGFTATCVVKFVGIPSEINMSSTDVSAIEGYYNLSANKTYNFNIELSNIFGQVGAETEFEIVKGGSGELYFGNQYIDYYTQSWENLQKIAVSSLFDKFLTVSVEGTTLKVVSSNKVFKTYYESSGWDESRGKTVYYKKYFDGSGSNGSSFSTEKAFNEQNVGNCYLTVQVVEKKTGINATLQFKIGTGVNGITIDSPSITF